MSSTRILRNASIDRIDNGYLLSYWLDTKNEDQNDQQDYYREFYPTMEDTTKALISLAKHHSGE